MDQQEGLTASIAGQHLDPRVVRTRKRVVNAVARLLAERGIAGVTMERVASEAGVARSTLYRYWSGPEALVAEMVDAFLEPPAADETGDLRRDLAVVLEDMAGLLGHGSHWSQVLPAVIAAGRVDGDIARRVERQAALRVDAVRKALEEGQARGQLPASADLDVICDELVGPLYYRRLVRDVDTDPDWVDRHVDVVLAGYVQVCCT